MGRAQLRPIFRNAKFAHPLALTETKIQLVEGEGLAAPNIQLGNGTGGLATVSALPMGLKNFVYPPGLTEPRIRSCHEEGLAASDRLQATGIGGPCRLYRKLTEELERTDAVQALLTAPERLA